MSVTVTQELTQQTVTVSGNPVENNVTVTVSNARGPSGGGGGSNSVTSATTSDGTANLSISNVTTATATVSGIMTAPTAATTTSTTQVATTAFVQQELASGVAVAKNLEFLAHNGSGVTIAKGSIVYVNGAVGGIPRVVKAQANNDTNSARTIGFVKADIADGENGFVIIEGELLNVSTADSISIIGAGIQLYLSPTTPGAFTRTKPSAPQHAVYVGVVVTASTGANLDGKILVGIQNGYELDDIHDVSITTPVAKQVIKRNAGSTLWVNEAIVSADVSDATDAATPSTLVRRDASGAAEFVGLAVTGGTTFGEESLVQFDAVEYEYGAGAAAAHRTALGATATGVALFTAATPAAARTTLGFDTAVPKIPITFSNSSDFSTASTSFVDVTDLSFPVAANKNYKVDIFLSTNKTDAAGMRIQLTGPVSPTRLFLRTDGTTTSLTTTTGNTFTSFGSPSNTFNMVNADGFFTTYGRGIIRNGANAGTVQLQLQAITSGTAKIYAGSTIVVTEL